MIRNNLKIALRYLWNNKRYSLINIGGLSLGFFCFLLLNFYVLSEKSFDPDSVGQYRLLQQEENPAGIREMATTGPRVGQAVRERFPEVEEVTQAMVLGRLTVGNDPENRQYERVTVIDPKFFDFFPLKFIEGNSKNAFSQSNGLILTESKARKYFGNGKALNQTLYTNIATCVVAAVVADIPETSHFTADLLLPEQTAESQFSWWTDFTSTNWHRNASVTYLSVRPGTDIAGLAQNIGELAEANWPADVPFQSTFSLQPVRDIHLYEGVVEGEINKGRGNPFYVRIFSWIALVILLVASFNYMGLLNVSYMNRAKEIGVRKVVGAHRHQLIMQFLVESLVLTTIALGIAISAVLIAQGLVEKWLGPSFSGTYLSFWNLFLLLSAGLVISLLSIIYPTIIISRLSPVRALREQKGSAGGFNIQKAILTFQFVASITLVACTLLFYRQVRYLQEKDPGFTSDGIVTVDINSGVLRGRFQAIKSAFESLPEVQNVSVSSRVPGEWKGFPTIGIHAPGSGQTDRSDMIFLGAGNDFTTTFEIPIRAGTGFSGSPSDSTKVLLNETAARLLSPGDAVGKKIRVSTINWGGDDNPLETPFDATVSGVVADFSFEDVHREIRPMVIGFRNNPLHNIDYYSLRINTEDWAATIASLKAINNRFDPENPLEYHMLNEQFARFYEDDIRRSRLMLFFTGTIVFISFMGLLTIAAYVLRNRTKEIGIRKVLGATATDLVQLIGSGFLKIILVASAIAIPLSWILMKNWLQEFAYRLPLSWGNLVLAALSILILGFITVGLQTLRISWSNPVKSLRTE